METFLQDLRFGFRMFLKNPGLSLISVLTFGLGIGLTTTIFSIVNGAMIDGLPFEDSERLVAIDRSRPSEDIERMGTTVHDLVEWRDQQSSFEGLMALSGGTVNLTGPDGRPERYAGSFVTAGAFRLLRVRPLLGRGFLDEEDDPGATPVIVLGYQAWHRQFGADSSVLGKTVVANGVPHTVIGVMPDGFEFPVDQEVWLPLEINPLEHERGEGPRYFVVGRLNDGVSLDEAGTEMAQIASRLAQEYPESNEGIGVLVSPYTERFIGGEIAALLYTMLGAVLAVLLIACSNVANLLLARVSVRTREVALRTALGASRSRVVRQLLAETLVLSALGGLLGLVIGYGGLEWFNNAVAGDPPPFWMVFDLNPRVLGFVAVVTVASSIFAGLMPALKASRTDINEVLKDEGRGTAGLRGSKLSGGLVVMEIALSCGLLIAAGLMIKSVVQLRNVDLPFTTEGIFTARLNLAVVEYPDTASRVRFYHNFLPLLTSIPGVDAATLSDGLPASGNGTRFFEVEGESYSDEADYPFAREGIVTPGYFDTFQAKILRGRAFSVSDRSNTLPVAIVNATFARNFFPEGDVLGRRIRMGRPDTTAKWLTVIGLVPDLKMEGIENQDASPAGFYIPIAQSGVGNFVSIAMRTRGPPLAYTDAVRSAVAQMDPNLPIYNVLSMEQVIENETWFYRIFGTLFMVFGFSALFLAVVGLYGVMSFAVSRRRHEMGVRLALGAGGKNVLALVMKRGVVQLAVGLGLGLGLAAVAAAPLQLVLYEVEAKDPMVFGSVVAILGLTGLLASFIPARQVSRIDPMTALRTE